MRSNFGGRVPVACFSSSAKVIALAFAPVPAQRTQLPPTVALGVIWAVRVSSALALTAGFGVDGRDVDALVVLQAPVGKRAAALAILVRNRGLLCARWASG